MARNTIAPPPTRFGTAGRGAPHLQPKMPGAVPPPPSRFGVATGQALQRKAPAPGAPPPLAPIRGIAVALQAKPAGIIQPSALPPTGGSGGGGGGGTPMQTPLWYPPAYGMYAPAYGMHAPAFHGMPVPVYYAMPSPVYYGPPSGMGAHGAAAPQAAPSYGDRLPIDDRMDAAVELGKAADIQAVAASGWETWSTLSYSGLNAKYWVDFRGTRLEIHVKWGASPKTDPPKCVTIKQPGGAQLKELTTGKLHDHLLGLARKVMAAPAKNAAAAPAAASGSAPAVPAAAAIAAATGPSPAVVAPPPTAATPTAAST